MNGSLTATNTTISGNEASTGWGGGIYKFTGSLTATNTTISGNTAGTLGGGLNINGGATLRFVTLTGNGAGTSGGGLVATGSAATTLFGSVVAGNTAPSGSDCSFAAILTSTGYNVVGGGFGCPSGGTGDLAYGGALSALLDPALDGNGGPTPTHALPDGSPAIDRVPLAQCGAANGADQRGFPRPVGPACDSGAYEGRSLTLVVTNGNDSGPGSLRQASLDAASGATITFAPGVTDVVLTTAGIEFLPGP